MPRSLLMNLFLSIKGWCNPYFKQVVSILKSERFMIGTWQLHGGSWALDGRSSCS